MRSILRCENVVKKNSHRGHKIFGPECRMCLPIVVHSQKTTSPFTERLRFLDPSALLDYTNRSLWVRNSRLVGEPKSQRSEFIAETHVSASCARAPQEARLPRAHEKPGWTESPCATPQERAPQPHASLIRRGSIFLAPAVSCAASNMTPCTATPAAGRAASSRFFFAPMASLSAALAGASKRRWAALSGATAFAAGSARFSDCTDRRLPRDGTS